MFMLLDEGGESRSLESAGSEGEGRGGGEEGRVSRSGGGVLFLWPRHKVCSSLTLQRVDVTRFERVKLRRG
jgi:hypothetical protein